METGADYRMTHASEFSPMPEAEYLELEQIWGGRQMYTPTDEDFEG